MNKKVSTETLILETGFAVFGRNASATMSDMAEAAGIGRATLHRHFPSRDALLKALAQQADHELDNAVAQATPDAVSYLDALQRSMCAIIPLANRQLFLTYALPPDHPDMSAAAMRGHAETRDAIQQAQAEGSLPTTLNPDWIARVYDGLIYAAWESIDAQELTPTQASTLAWRTFLSGIEGAEK
ncbi:MAG: TetR/AcrR family transcriptional regulator [Paracoccaceae bacterium]